MQIYGIFIVLGIIFSYLFTFNFIFSNKIKKYVSENFFIDFFIIVYFLSIIFGRLFFYYFDNEDNVRFLRIYEGGFSVIGAAIGGIIGYALIYLYSMLKKTNINNNTFSYMAIIPLLIHAFGRLGCYFANCCNGIFFYNIPIQIVSSIWYFTFFIIGFCIWNFEYFKNYFYALMFYIFTILLERFIFDSFREDKIIVFSYKNLFEVTKYQFISLFIIFFILFIYFKILNRKKF